MLTDIVKISFGVIFVGAILLLAILLLNITSGTDVVLEADSEDIIGYKPIDIDTLKYVYVTTPVEQKENEVIEKRTEHSYTVSNDDGTHTLTAYSGQAFHEKDSVWRMVEYATTTPKRFAQATRKNILQRFLFSRVYAATLTQQSTAAGDGTCSAGDSTADDQIAWDTARGQSSADSCSFGSAVQNFYTFVSGEFHGIARAYYPFDTSSIPVGATIQSATFDITVLNEAGSGDREITLLESSQNSETALTQSDWIDLNSSEGTDTRVALTSTGQKTITLNATGLGWIKVSGEAPTCGATNGYTCLGIRYSNDFDDVIIVDNVDEMITALFHSEQTGVDDDPTLNVTYVTNIGGRVYTGEGSIPIAGGKTIALSLNGGAATATTTDASGDYLIDVSPSAGDTILVYLDDESEKGVTVTVSDGGSLDNLHIYQDHLIVREDNSGYMTNSIMSTASDSDGDVDYFYTVTSGDLTVATTTAAELYVASAHTFKPHGNVTVGDSVTHSDIEILGTLTADGNSLTTNGDWISSGTFGYGTSTVTFSGSADQTLTSGGSPFNNLTLNNTGSSGTDNIVATDALAVDGVLTITDGDLDLNASDPNAEVGGNITVGTNGSWDRGTGTMTLDGTTTFTDNAGDFALGNILVSSSTAVASLTLGSNATSSYLHVHTDETLTLGTYTLYLNNGAGTTTPLDVVGTFTPNTSTVVYKGTTASTTIDAQTYYALELDSSAIHVLEGATNASSTLTVTSGTLDTVSNNIHTDGTVSIVGQLNGHGGNISVGGDYTNTGTFAPGTSTLVFASSSAQSISSGGSSLYNLTHSGTGTLTISDTTTIANNLVNSTSTLEIDAVTTVTGSITNIATITEDAGYIKKDATISLDQLIYYLHYNVDDVRDDDGINMTLTDEDENLDGTSADTATTSVTLAAGSDTEVVILTETGAATGIFTASLSLASTTSYTPDNEIIEFLNRMNDPDTATITYTDDRDHIDDIVTIAPLVYKEFPTNWDPTNQIRFSTAAEADARRDILIDYIFDGPLPTTIPTVTTGIEDDPPQVNGFDLIRWDDYATSSIYYSSLDLLISEIVPSNTLGYEP